MKALPVFTLIGLLFPVMAVAYPPDIDQGPAPPPVKDRTQLTVSRIYQGDDFKLDQKAFRWHPNQPFLYRIENEDDQPPNIITKSLTDEVDTVELPLDATEKIDSVSFSKDGRFALAMTRSQKVWRQNTLGEFWLINLKDQSKQMIAGGDAIMFATIDLKASKVAFVRDRGLFVEDISTGKITTIAASEDPNLIHGTFDWVYEEELGLRKGFAFNEDGSKIAFWKLDETGVPKHTMIDNASGRYPTIKQFAYPKVGQTNSSAEIHVYDFTTQKTTRMEIGGDPREHYLAAMQWTPKINEDVQQRLLIQQLNRPQNENRLWLADPETGQATVLLFERSPGWLTHQPKLHEIPSRTDEPGTIDFVWESERSGWRHLYRLSLDEEILTSPIEPKPFEQMGLFQDPRPPLDRVELEPLTHGEWDVIEVKHAGIGGQILFIASPDNATQRGLYRIDLDSIDPAAVVRVSPQQSGTFQYEIDSTGTHAVESWSDFQSPPIKRLIRIEPYDVIRTLADNEQAVTTLAELDPIEHQFVQLAIEDEVSLDAWIMLPKGLPAETKVPLLVHVYGEPAGSTVRDVYGGNTYLWHRLMVQNGIAVASIDNRGTKSPRGRAFRQSIYRQIGILPPKDQAAGVQRLLQRFPQLDASRVGVWGWSGGGSSSLHAIFRYPDLFKTAVAVAPVSQQRDYDTIYQERYMGLLEGDVDHFDEGSPITHADGLQGSLLIIHGTGDDNVHYASTTRLINKLVAKGKPFEMMAYPGRSHAIVEGTGTVMHLRSKMTDFLLKTLLGD